MRSLTCHCEKTFEADLPESIDLDRDEECLKAIISGDFMNVTCPNCGSLLKPELATRLSSAKRGLDLYALPESERFSVYAGTVEAPKGCELLVGYAELRERAFVLQAKLDARVVEILKYHLLAKALQSPGAEEEVIVSFAGKQADGRLRFELSGLKPGELAVLALPFDRYERAVSESSKTLKTEPFATIFAGVYRSIRSLEASEG